MSFRLEIVDCPGDKVNADRIGDAFDDLLRRLICLRSFIERCFADRPCADALESLCIFFKGKAASCAGAAHQTSCTVRSGIVPFGVALACSDDNAVTHIKRDTELLTIQSGDCALANDDRGMTAVVPVYIVMDRIEGLRNGDISDSGEMIHDLLCDTAAVFIGVVLCEEHTVDIAVIK